MNPCFYTKHIHTQFGCIKNRVFEPVGGKNVSKSLNIVDWFGQ